MPSTRTAALAAVLSSAASVVAAFTSPAVTSSATSKKSTTSIYSTVDPSVVTKKEYQDICGVDFDDRAMQDRLRKTAYLYPKHVEVIEDFEPLVNQMVDDIVSEKINADRMLFGRLDADAIVDTIFIVTRNQCTLSPLNRSRFGFYIICIIRHPQ